jgi:ADP-heptose:LPS heptosyltransferase
VDRVLHLEGKDAAGLVALGSAWRSVAAEPPLVAVNLHGSGPASHRALAALRPARLVAVDCPGAGVAGPVWQLPDEPEEHQAARWCRVVASALGVEADPHDLLLDPPAQAAPVTGAVVVHPGAAYGSRRWPPDRWAAVAREAARAGHPVVVTGTGDERPLAEEVRRRAGLPPETVLAGRTDLAELAALVSAARLVTCGDTGMAHLASAYRTPSVVLFGPTSPRLWGPPRDGPHTVLWRGDGTGDPSGAAPDPALLALSVEEVLEAVGDRLARGRTLRSSDWRTTPASA